MKEFRRPSIDPSKQYVCPGEEDQMEIEGYRLSRVRWSVTLVAMVTTVGLLRLVFHWKPEWMVYCTHIRCSLELAEKVVLRDQYKQVFVEEIITTTKDGTRVKVLDNSGTCCYGYHKDTDSKTNLIPITKDNFLVCHFINKKLKYIWEPNTRKKKKVPGLEEVRVCSYFHENTTGLTEWEQQNRRITFGDNSILVRVTPIIKLLFHEVLNPFYIFQIFSIILWYCDEYEFYASCIVLISVISISTGIYQTRKMQVALRNTIQSSSIVSVLRCGVFEDIHSDLLVPGDIIAVPRDGCIMQCDAVLISGNCIVNESMLTGESVPVTKTPLPNTNSNNGREVSFDMKEHGKHVLFCGTHVIQTRYYGSAKVKAVVIRTSFMTSKGELVRSILHPKPFDFRFNQDTYKFVGFLAGIASLGFLFTIIIMSIQGETVGHIILRGLDLVTIAVAPALPAALTVGTVFAQRRLRTADVFCISPSSINVCGTINCFCFDKTGTLTEDGLDMYGIVQTDSNARFQELWEDSSMLSRGHFQNAMATCHSLTMIDNVLSGDPLDLKMFQATHWELEEIREDSTKFDVMMPSVVRPKKPDIIASSESIDSMGMPSAGMYEIGIIRQFTFSSSLQRMSVITRTLGESHFNLYAKGSPEMIASLSKPETVPSDFHDVLMNYTQQGYRVIAVATKRLKLSYVKLQRVERKVVENDLDFLGLIIMVNKLKPETSPVIKTLKDAAIRTVMVTGDNILTALSVARDCHMIDPADRVIVVNATCPSKGKQASIDWVYADNNKTVEELQGGSKNLAEFDVSHDHYHFALTGKSWAIMKQHFTDILPKLVVRGAVFARMSPDQKAQLIESLQELGYYVGMCGDGANDCGALKTAHTGISLSEAEASVASPFTSKQANIKCVPTVIKEGRAALVTSFGIFKYIACYSLTQFVTVLILYWIGANLTDLQFLYIDLVLLTSLSITFGRTSAYPALSREPPLISLFSAVPILSLMVQTCVQLTFQVVTYYYVIYQPWFVPYVVNPEEEYASYENYCLFCVSAFQYITLAVIFSKGAPYRKNIFSNYLFLVNILSLTIFTAYVTIYPAEFLQSWIELLVPKSIYFRLILVGFAATNFLVSILLEMFLIDNVGIRRRWRQTKENCLPNTMVKHMLIEKEIKSEPDWPPVSESVSSLADLTKNEFQPTTERTKSTIIDMNHDDVGNGDWVRRRHLSAESSITNDSVEISFQSSRQNTPVKLLETRSSNHTPLSFLGNTTDSLTPDNDVEQRPLSKSTILLNSTQL